MYVTHNYVFCAGNATAKVSGAKRKRGHENPGDTDSVAGTHT